MSSSSCGSPLPPQLGRIDPLESGIEFFEEQKKFTFLFKYQCNKVFLNHVDSFNGRHIIRYVGSREYVKPLEFEELPGEGGSLPPIVEAPSSPASAADITDDEQEPDITKGPESDERSNEDLIPEGFAGEATQDSLYSILGGLFTDEQLKILRSLPNRALRADYLKNLLNQMQQEIELTPEEAAEPLCYEIAGTLKYCDDCLPEIRMFLKERVRNLKSYLPSLLSCSTVIFDITKDPSQIEEARWALRAILCSFQYLERKSQLCFQRIKDVRKFILISSAMTWENTDRMKIRKKPVNEENLPLRKPHPLFKEHKHLEQEVIRAGLKYKDKFKTYVLASGITYGYEEDKLNYLFDLGWKNEQELPLLGIGHNSLPIIHVEDLAMIVFYCMTRVAETPTYLFTVEKNPPTLLQITEGISRGLTTGNTKMYDLNEQLPENISLHEDTFATLTSELLLEPSIHKLELPWKYNMNMVENMAAIIDEYIECRNLCPFRILIVGAPSSGKTQLAERLAEIYDVLYLNIEQVVQSYVEKLEKEAMEMAAALEMMKPIDEEVEESMKSGNEETSQLSAGDEERLGEEETAPSGEAKFYFDNELDEIKHSMLVNGGIPEDSLCFRILKKRLESMDIVNHGYVLDGWPETAPQAHGMFGKDEPEELPSPEMSAEEDEVDDEEEEAEDEEAFGEDQQVKEPIRRNINIQPNYLIQLDGDCDDLLFKNLASKKDLERAQPSSIKLAERMETYRDLEKIGCRAFDYFDNNILDLKILRYKIGADPCPFLGRTLKHILNSLGPPTNKGLLKRYLEEYIMIRNSEQSEKDKKLKEASDGMLLMDYEYFRVACQFMDQWVDFKDKNVKERTQCADGLLEDNILPEQVVETTLKALITFKQASPDDHLQFLAEYFLREYEKEKGRTVIQESECDGAVAFRRCVASVLNNCDPYCLPLLPQAVDVIMKYRRFAAARGDDFPPESCRKLSVDGSGDAVVVETEPEDKDNQRSELDTGSSNLSVCSFGDDNDDGSDSDKSLNRMNLKELVEVLNKTNPIWKDKIKTEVVTGKKTISDQSLKLLLEQLRQLSCEIRYRLKKRGISNFDDDSPVGSLGQWPRQGPDSKCSGEIRTQHSSAPSLDMKVNLELIKKFYGDDFIILEGEGLEQDENGEQLITRKYSQPKHQSDSSKKSKTSTKTDQSKTSDPTKVIPKESSSQKSITSDSSHSASSKKPSINQSDVGSTK